MELENKRILSYPSHPTPAKVYNKDGCLIVDFEKDTTTSYVISDHVFVEYQKDLVAITVYIYEIQYKEISGDYDIAEDRILKSKIITNNYRIYMYV